MILLTVDFSGPIYYVSREFSISRLKQVYSHTSVKPNESFSLLYISLTKYDKNDEKVQIYRLRA